MALTYFKAQKSGTGALFSIKFVAKSNKQGEDFKPGGFFINIVKQTGWNEKNHTGKFSGGDSISFKLDQFEAGRLLHVIERNYDLGDISGKSRDDLKPLGFYNMHSGGNQTTHINFVPWQRKGDKEQSGFALYVTKVVDNEKTNFGAAFSFGEDITLREYIKLGLEHINMAGYAEDKRRFEEGVKSNGNSESDSEAPASYKKRSTGRTVPAKAAPEPEPEATEDDPDDSLF